ncbi:MAG: VWA domain-containing protein, partial [Thermoleophilia bacterium]|nr:VWA domain-containing protein [Thermoleophilia bacterium]
MTLLSPVLLLTLLAVPFVIALVVLAERRRMRFAVRYTNVDVLASVAGGRPWRRLVPLGLFLASLAALGVAVARPQIDTTVTQDKATVVLVVDHSGSMFADDVRPTRLGAAQEAVRAFLDKVPDGVRVSLVVFAAEPFVVTPPTTDLELVRRSVDSLGSFPVRGTAIGDALSAAVELAERAIGTAPAEPGAGGGTTIAYHTSDASPSSSLRLAADADPEAQSPASILFLSDGAQTRGFLTPSEGADRAAAAGIPVYTVSLGTDEGVLTRDFGNGFEQEIPVPPDPETLQQIAQATGGEFFDARSAEALESAYSSLGSSLARVPGTLE